MSFPKILALGSLVIFSAIGGIAFFKKEKSKEPEVKQKELWTNLVKDTSEIAINEDTASEDIFEFNLVYCDAMVKNVMNKLKSISK